MAADHLIEVGEGDVPRPQRQPAQKETTHRLIAVRAQLAGKIVQRVTLAGRADDSLR
jgi:hypothetical protein